MLSCLSFKRGCLCQSSQIRKTEVAERLYLALGVEEGVPGAERIAEGQLSCLGSREGASAALGLPADAGFFWVDSLR